MYQGNLNNENEDYSYKELSQKLDPKAPIREWGCLIHPDEIRKIFHYGNSRFVSINGDTFTDNQIKNWIDQTVIVFQNLLNHDIYPRLWRVRPQAGQDPIEVYNSIEPFAEFDDSYEFKFSEANFHQLKLRHRPVFKIFKWHLISPYSGQVLMDLTSRVIANYYSGILKSTYLLPHAMYGGFEYNPSMSIAQYRTFFSSSGIAIPGAYIVEYSTGYPHANHVPKELVEQIQKLITCAIASAYGDGITSGISNYSISLSGISESIGTTRSSGSTMFGARINQLMDEVKTWIEKNKIKYSGIKVGVL